MSVIYDETIAAGKRMGGMEERFRIARAITDLPGEKCQCAQWTVEIGFHATDCHQGAVEHFREQVLEAIFPASESASNAGERAQTGGTFDADSASAESLSQRSLTGGGVTA